MPNLTPVEIAIIVALFAALIGGGVLIAYLARKLSEAGERAGELAPKWAVDAIDLAGHRVLAELKTTTDATPNKIDDEILKLFDARFDELIALLRSVNPPAADKFANAIAPDTSAGD